MSSLKNQYKSKLLAETKRVNLVLEALDAKQVQNVANAVAALEKLIPREKMPMIYTAVSSAKNELGKSLSGGLTTAVIQKFTQPLGKSIALADGLKAAFKMLPQLIKSFVPQNQQNVTTKPIQDVIDQSKSKQFAEAFLNAVRPTGVVATLGKLFGNGGIPFLDKPLDAVYEMMENMSIAELHALATSAGSVQTTISQDVAKEVENAAQQPQQTQSTQQPQQQQPQQTPQNVSSEYEKFKGIIPNLTPEQKSELTKLLTNAQPFQQAKN